MKFKVGDRVRLVKVNNELNCYKEFLNKSFTIKSFDKDKFGSYAHLEETSDICPYLENLELFEYTYENLKKTPVGTKVTFENGKVYTRVNLINGRDCFTDSEGYRSVEDLKGLKDNWCSRILGKIIKIEEPQYTTVYEAKKEILDDVEKRYLKEVIRPYKDVISIRKCSLVNCSLAKIVISVPYTEGHNLWSIELPPFKKNTMYKNMEPNKDYTLTELGLKE